MVDPRQGLDCLSQSHFVGEQAVVLVVPREVQPVDALQLVRPQRVAILEGRRLLILHPLLLVGTLYAGPVLLSGWISPSKEVLNLLGVNISLQLPGAILIWEGPPLDKVMLGSDLSLFISVLAGIKDSINLNIVGVEGFLLTEVEHVTRLLPLLLEPLDLLVDPLVPPRQLLLSQPLAVQVGEVLELDQVLLHRNHLGRGFGILCHWLRGGGFLRNVSRLRFGF